MAFDDFLPLTRETIQTVRARLDADANPGLAPSSDEFIDTTEGGFYWDLTAAPALEIERLWDFFATEVIAAMFPAFSFGRYLDYWGESLDLPRKDAARATGTVTFTGISGTTVPSGVQVGTVSTDPEKDSISFRTTESKTITAGTAAVAVEAVEAGAAGNVAANSITQIFTATGDISAVTNASPTTGGVDVETDERYQERILLEFAGAQGPGTSTDYKRWALAYPGIGYVKVEPLWDGPGTVRVIVTDTNNDPVSQTTINGLQAELDPASATTTLNGAHTLPVTTLTVVSTTGFTSSGKVMVNGQSVSYTGTTATTFTGCSGGTGVQATGSTVAQGGRGAGTAPIGAQVTVATATNLFVDVYAVLTFVSGYTLDGTGGTIPTRSSIEAAVRDYIDKLGPDDDVVLNHVRAQFFRVRGVIDVPTLTLNGSAANVTIGPLEVAQTVSTVSTTTTSSVTLPVATIPVVSTTGFRTAGRIFVNAQTVTYTGVTATSFTGCTGGTGVQASGSPVKQGVVLS